MMAENNKLILTSSPNGYATDKQENLTMNEI